MMPKPPVTLDDNGEGDHKTPGSQGGVQSAFPANSQGTDPSNPAATDPAASQTAPNHPADPGGNTPGGNPNAVQQLKEVSYQEAKDLLDHPIVECFESNFMNYEIMMVSQHGDWNGYYFGVKYIFTNGKISLIDQDRLHASVCSDSDINDKVEYNGHTFFITKENYRPDSQIEM